jgi:hypothetical protein
MAGVEARNRLMAIPYRILCAFALAATVVALGQSSQPAEAASLPRLFTGFTEDDFAVKPPTISYTPDASGFVGRLPSRRRRSSAFPAPSCREGSRLPALDGVE